MLRRYIIPSIIFLTNSLHAKNYKRLKSELNDQEIWLNAIERTWSQYIAQTIK